MTWNYYDIKKEEVELPRMRSDGSLISDVSNWNKGKLMRQLNDLSSRFNTFLMDMVDSGLISEDDISSHTKLIDMLEKKIMGE
tara:strand:- start:361 stop:609 length:249 start_codon:yes stop_codon:yes gene_type:complete